MNHKRKRPANRRAGCKLWKPWKINGFRTERPDGERFSDHRRRVATDEEIEAYWEEAFANSQDVLAKLADEAIAERKAGRTQPLHLDLL